MASDRHWCANADDRSASVFWSAGAVLIRIDGRERATSSARVIWYASKAIWAALGERLGRADVWAQLWFGGSIMLFEIKYLYMHALFKSNYKYK
ncbi:hypothetical protein [Brucella sp. 22210]|uniref:hypothetical protein n=1 Tax=Brucella sp. 22210 TaxID=3453892 RepID=UPI003F85591F